MPGPQGVRGRNSDNRRLREVLGWEPQISLEDGLTRTYAWIDLDLIKRPDGNYGVEVSYVKNGPALALQAPRWPMVQGDGRLTMEAVVQPDGSLTDIKLVASEFSSPIARKQFGLAVETALRHSHALPELVDGKPIATRMQIPVSFEKHEGPPIDAKAKVANQTAHAPAPLASAPDDMSGLAVALDSPVQPISGSPPG